MISARAVRLLVPLTLGVAALTVVCGRFVIQARAAVGAARVAAAAGDRIEATRLYLDALRAYVPGTPFERQALDGLAQLAVEAARSGDREGQRRALEAIRAGLLGTRSIYLPYASRLDDANHRLADLNATEAFPPRDPARIVVERARPRGPMLTISAMLLALVGFAIWVGGILLFIRAGVDRTAVHVRRMGRCTTTFASRSPVLPPILFVVGFALFLMGLRLT